MSDLNPDAPPGAAHPADMPCPFSRLRVPRAPSDPCCALRTRVVREELGIFRVDVLALGMICNQSSTQAHLFANELYEAAAQIERDYTDRMEERLGAHRGGTIDAETGLVVLGQRSTVREATKLIRLAGDWYQEATLQGLSVEVH